MAGLSDPYAILRVGPQTFKSQHMDNTDSPKWAEMYEVNMDGSSWSLDICVIITLHMHVITAQGHFPLFCV